MSDKNFPAQHVRQGAEGADGNLLSLQISPSLNLRSDDKTMQKKLFTHIDYFSLDVPGHYSVKSARRVSKLKRIVKKSHAARDVSSITTCRAPVLASRATLSPGDPSRHAPHPVS